MPEEPASRRSPDGLPCAGRLEGAIMRRLLPLLAIAALGFTDCGWRYMGYPDYYKREDNFQCIIQVVADLRRVYEAKGPAALASARRSDDFWRDRDPKLYGIRKDVGMREFFIPPRVLADECMQPADESEERMVQVATEFQALMVEMESHPGRSAGTWGKFRDKVGAYWTYRDGTVGLPIGAEAVLTLYARVSGVDMIEQGDLDKRWPEHQDQEQVLNALLRDVLTSPSLKKSRAYYGTSGGRKVALVTNQSRGVPWPATYRPDLPGWTVSCLDKIPEQYLKGPHLLGIRIDKCFHEPKDGAGKSRTTLVVTILNVGGDEGGPRIGGCILYYLIEKVDGKWAVGLSERSEY
jgi:hypothetical protein